MAALALLAVYRSWSGLAIDVGDQASPQEMFFGTEYRNPDVAKFAIPIEAVAGVFFVLIALMFVGLGQVLGRAFDACPDRVHGLHLQHRRQPRRHRRVLGLVLRAGAAVDLVRHQLRRRRLSAARTGALTRPRALALIGVVAAIAIQGSLGRHAGDQVAWSPYYAVDFQPDNLEISVNNIGHQQIVPFDKGGSPIR